MYMFCGCSSLSSITIPPSVSTISAISSHSGNFYDPFTGCTLLIAKAQALKMPVKEYLLHRNEKIRPRVTVLICLEVYQRMQEAESATRERERLLSNVPGAYEKLIEEGGNRVRGGGEFDGRRKEENKGLNRISEALQDNNENTSDRNNKYLNAPLAYKMINAFELWREICKFL